MGLAAARMFDVQNLYESPCLPKKRSKQRSPRKVTLFDLRPVREADVEATPHTRKNPTGTIKTDVGNSQFYSKHGIRPISDTGSGDRPIEGASIKIKKMTRLYEGNTKFPKLQECAHFHYDFVELGPIEVIIEDTKDVAYRTSTSSADGDAQELFFWLHVTSNGKSWLLRRTYDNFRLFDKQLHRCIFDRKYSLLPELRIQEVKEEGFLAMRKLLSLYLHRFSSIAGNMINCGPVLSWLEMDNRGHRMIVTDDSAINTPAIAAAHVIRRYTAQAADEISFEVGDMVSIIDMPPNDETGWWRGKRGFEVGFFPSECVEIIGDKIPQAVTNNIPQTPVKPVLRKRGKLISFLRAFFTSRPARTTLKRSGIVKERVFGCDLGEHLLNLGHDVPLVLKSCAEVIETHGIVDGIYRLSGVASNIQKLRNEFDQDHVPDLTSEEYLQDIHSISSLLKMYFRELPNPLLTYQLYDKFANAVQDHEHRLMMVHDVIQQLPPPHYRTAEYLIRHLNRVAQEGHKTGMHCKNLAIVWAPNLLRSKELEQSCSTAALQGVGLQAIVTEFLIQYADFIFSDTTPGLSADNQSGPGRRRPKSLAISTPTKLISLEEAREQIFSMHTPSSPRQKYIEVGGGPEQLPKDYHTVIDLPHKKKSRRDRKSPVSGWRSIFYRRAQSWKKEDDSLDGHDDSLAGPSSLPIDALTEEDLARRRRLRTVRSVDSLLSGSTSLTNSPRHSDNLNSSAATIINPYIDEYRSVRPKSMTTERIRVPKRSRSYERSHSDAGVSGMESPPNEVFVDGENVEQGTHMKSNLVTELERRFQQPSSSQSSEMSPSDIPGDNSSLNDQQMSPRSQQSIAAAYVRRSLSLDQEPLGYGGKAPVPPPRRKMSPQKEDNGSDIAGALSRDMSPPSSQQKSPGYSFSLDAQYLAGEATASTGCLSDSSMLSETQSPHADHSMLSSSPRDHSMSGDSNISKSHLLPIGDILPMELAESPGSVQHSRLSHGYRELEDIGQEGAHCQLAAYDRHLLDEDLYNTHNLSLTTESDSDLERREALCNPDNSQDDEEQYAKVSSLQESGRPMSAYGLMSDNYMGSSKAELEHGRSYHSQDNLPGSDTYPEQMTQVTNMTQSLDSLLQEAAGADVYNSEWEQERRAKQSSAESMDQQSLGRSQDSDYLQSKESIVSRPYDSTSIIDDDSPAADNCNTHLLQSPTSPKYPSGRVSHADTDEGSLTPTNSQYYMVPQDEDVVVLKRYASNSGVISESDTDISQDNIVYEGAISAIPDDLLYPASTAIDLSSTDVQYVHPRYNEFSDQSEAIQSEEQSDYKAADDVSLGYASETDGFPHPNPLSEGESGRIVIRRPVDYSPEGALHVAETRRLTLPSRQIATMAPLPLTQAENQHADTSNSDNSTCTKFIDSPLEEKPLSTAASRLMYNDGYTADRSSSSSPTYSEEKRRHASRKLSPDLPPHAEHVHDMPDKGMTGSTTDMSMSQHSDIGPTDLTDSTLMFAMDEDGRSDEFMVSSSEDQLLLKSTSSDDVFQSDAAVRASDESDILLSSTSAAVSSSKSSSQQNIDISDSSIEGRKSRTKMFTVRSSAGTERSPAKRKKSVKELLSQFEVLHSSPPSASELKSDIPVFQKNKAVKLNELDTSSDNNSFSTFPRQRPLSSSWQDKSDSGHSLMDVAGTDDHTLHSNHSTSDTWSSAAAGSTSSGTDHPADTISTSPRDRKPRQFRTMSPESRPSTLFSSNTVGKAASDSRYQDPGTSSQVTLRYKGGKEFKETGKESTSQDEKRLSSLSQKLHKFEHFAGPSGHGVETTTTTTNSRPTSRYSNSNIHISKDVESHGDSKSHVKFDSIAKPVAQFSTYEATGDSESHLSSWKESGSDSSMDRDFARKLSERRRRVDRTSEAKENKDPSVEQNDTVSSSKVTQKWRYGQKDSTSEDDVGTRSKSDLYVPSRNSQKSLGNQPVSPTKDSPTTTKPKIILKAGNTGHADIKAIQKEGVLSLAQRRRQFESSEEASSGGSVGAGAVPDQAAVDTPEAAPSEGGRRRPSSSVKDLQGRFERATSDRASGTAASVDSRDADRHKSWNSIL